MPFVSTHGGWVEKYQRDDNDEGREINLCAGWRMPWDPTNNGTYQVWYSGAYSQKDKNFHEDEIGLWRVQSQQFDDDMWGWFLSDKIRKRWALHECRYIEDANDVINNNDKLGNEFQFPLSVLKHMISLGLIKSENMKRLIDTRIRMEEDAGFTEHTLKERKEAGERLEEKKKEKAASKVSEVAELLNPKKKVKAKV